jgi:hypothetical protein
MDAPLVSVGRPTTRVIAHNDDAAVRGPNGVALGPDSLTGDKWESALR